jgi:hypothetical protein
MRNMHARSLFVRTFVKIALEVCSAILMGSNGAATKIFESSRNNLEEVLVHVMGFDSLREGVITNAVS